MIKPLSCFDKTVDALHFGWDELRLGDRRGTMLAAKMLTGSLLPDPTRLGQHKGPDEVDVGQVFTLAAGFIDLGHLRNYADHTLKVFERLLKCGGRAGSIVKTPHGELRLLQDVPLDRETLADIALRAVWEDSVAYEQFSYGVRVFGQTTGFGLHTSGFSPEDLVSNYVGIRLARDSIMAGGDFAAQMTARIQKAMVEFKAQPAARAAEAIQKAVDKGWLAATGGWRAMADPNFLHRRNFTREPFRVGFADEMPAPAWVSEPLPEVMDLYDYTHTLGTRISRAEQPELQRRVEADAHDRYGDYFDRA